MIEELEQENRLLRARNERLHAECEALRAYAERYLWLRDIATDADWMFVREAPVKETDAAIDAARAAKGNQ